MASVVVPTLIGVALVGAFVVAWRMARSRLSFHGERHRFGPTKVFDGVAEYAPRGDEGDSFSCYVCYIRRARDRARPVSGA
jgi:hypothetical protein